MQFSPGISSVIILTAQSSFGLANHPLAAPSRRGCRGSNPASGCDNFQVSGSLQNRQGPEPNVTLHDER